MLSTGIILTDKQQSAWHGGRKIQMFSNRNKFHYKNFTLQDICRVYESVIVTEQNNQTVKLPDYSHCCCMQAAPVGFISSGNKSQKNTFL